MTIGLWNISHCHKGILIIKKDLKPKIVKWWQNIFDKNIHYAGNTAKQACWYPMFEKTKQITILTKLHELLARLWNIDQFITITTISNSLPSIFHYKVFSFIKITRYFHIDQPRANIKVLHIYRSAQQI